MRAAPPIEDTQGNDHLFAERIPSAPIPPAWQRRLGEYEVANSEGDRSAFSDVRLYEQDGLLLMAYRYNLLFESIDGDENEPTIKALLPLSDTEVAIHGLGRNNGEVLRIESHGDQELLYFSGYLLRSH